MVFGSDALTCHSVMTLWWLNCSPNGSVTLKSAVPSGTSLVKV